MIAASATVREQNKKLNQWISIPNRRNVNCFAASAKLRKRHLPLFHHFSSGREQQILVDFFHFSIFFFLSFLADCVELLPPTNGTKFFFRRRKLFFWFGWKKSKKNRKWSSRLFFLGKFCFFSPQKSTSLLLLVQMTKKNLSANAESFCLPRWLFFETKRKRKSPFIFGIHSRGVQCRRKKTEEGKKTLRFLHLDFFTHKMLYRAKKSGIT